VITQDVIKGLKDDELPLIEGWIQTERAERADKRKRDTIARIRELAAGVGISVAIEGVRGRPRRPRVAGAPDRPPVRAVAPVKTAPAAASAPPQAARGSSARPQ